MWVFNKEKFLKWVDKQRDQGKFSNYISELHRLEGKTLDQCFAMGYMVNRDWLVFKSENGDV